MEEKKTMPHREFDDTFKDLSPEQRANELALFRRLFEGLAKADPERFKDVAEMVAKEEGTDNE